MTINFKHITKKLTTGALVATMAFALTACGGNQAAEGNAQEGNAANTGNAATETAATAEGPINVISREEGSGTRSAFTEIVGLIEKDDAGNEKDMTSEEAAVQNSTDAVLTAVSNDVAGIGYISLGSLNDTVKALKVEGTEATAENIVAGTYPIARPFNIAYKGEPTPEVKDFLAFIASEEAGKIAEEEGYVPNPEAQPYEPADVSGSITIAGSTSVTPLMEKLVEAYKVHNPNFNADIQATGSSAGMKSAMDGTAQIGMASRELKEDEAAALNQEVICRDGIAVVINNDNATEDMTIDQIKNIFNGTTTDWAEVNAK
ncbi:substrate-binding domain-containing protein [Peptoniphilus equinus]|uniref:Substrate-binding domain-containing protein n=1 Tax=Peptoniphilus equinus TaxID=3016343 RepID=A0ABY7QSH1_9FIRM|nr:substrate-binding domain-containing protein [Peptoniphilus equinus]WBW49692.1 substrate-binding domain-containing protein [Peptoniphilus equinus]